MYIQFHKEIHSVIHIKQNLEGFANALLLLFTGQLICSFFLFCMLMINQNYHLVIAIDPDFGKSKNIKHLPFFLLLMSSLSIPNSKLLS